MQILRLTVLALVLLALAPLTAHAQQLQAGSSLYFDHPVQDALDTSKYQLCVDGVDDAKCVDIATLKVADTTFTFTLPASAPRGSHSLQVRAVGFGDFGASDGSNALSIRIIGKPGPPVLLRLQQAVTGGGL